MKQKTHQTLSGLKPRDRQTKIGLRIQCVKCKTIRVFAIGESLNQIVNRDMQSFNIDTYCETCKYQITVGIDWIETKYGYTATDQRIREIKELVVEDDMGMVPLHSDKN